MIKRLFTKPLALELGPRTVTFNTLSDFEFGLASRVEVPATKVSELVKFAPEELQREAASIRKVEKNFVDMLARSLEEAGTIGHMLREMDLKYFSQDHDWRDIIRTLLTQPAEFDEFKKIAVVKYMQYLGSRQDVLKSLYAAKGDARPSVDELDAGGGGDQAALHETLIFDVSQVASPEESSRLERLPKGETVAVRLAPTDEMEIILSRHRFTLVPGPHAYLVDQSGTDYRLRSGRNVIGRLPGSDIAVDAAYRDMSRRHLVVDVRSDSRFELTDLSSHGTFILRSYLDRTGEL